MLIYIKSGKISPHHRGAYLCAGMTSSHHDDSFLSHFQTAFNILAENSFHYWLMDPMQGLGCLVAAVNNFIQAGVARRIREPIFQAVNVCPLLVEDALDSLSYYLCRLQ